MTTEIATYLKYADLQMAAEALYELKTAAPGSTFSGSITNANLSILTDGNDRSSKFTQVQASEFKDDWEVVEHISNTATGFSGTLFRALHTDESKGIVVGELVLSFRSTEFADDATRDNQATNTLEIKEKGWAFGQIADMESWYASLKLNGKIPAGAQFSVTGYSLGGHLATAFNLLRQEDANKLAGTPNPISATYTFNGAGVGKRLNGKSLSEVIASFNEVRNNGALSSFGTAEGKALYQQVKGTLAAYPDATALSTQRQLVDQAIATAKQRPPTETGPQVADYQLLSDALERARIVAAERDRVAGLTNSGVEPLDTNLADVAAVNLDYQLAALIAAKNTESLPIIGGVINTLQDDRDYAPNLIANFYDLYASNFPTAVANSQLHYGKDIGIIVEDQPLHRGLFFGDVLAQSSYNWNIKLLVNDFSNNDFGDTHSLVLIVDSLNVQNTLAKLDATFSTAKFVPIMQAATNTKGETVLLGQRKAEGDALDKIVTALARQLGVTIPELKPSLNGNTWYEVADKDGNTGRDTFYTALKAVTDSAAFQAIEGDAVIRTSSSDLRAAARNDFGAAAALMTLSPFWIAGKDAAGKAALETKWESVHGEDFLAWQEDKSTATAATFTDQWIADRSAMLGLVVQRNLGNSQGILPGTTNARYYDAGSDTQILVGAGAAIEQRKQYVFGGEGADALTGYGFGDHLYGGAGADTLRGLGGADYLQGDAGDDILEGGAGNDTLVGGADSDTYRFSGTWGVDTVIDADGLGRIEVDGVALSGGKKLSANEWQSDDEQWSYLLTSQGDLAINKKGEPGRIVVRNWTQIQQSAGATLGIVLQSEEVSPPPVTQDVWVFQGDQDASAGDWILLPDGNFSEAEEFPGRDDIVTMWNGYETSFFAIVASSANGTVTESRLFTSMHYSGLGGDDVVSGTRNDDFLEGGDGDDVIFGGLGSDHIVGGAGKDVIVSNISAFYNRSVWSPLSNGEQVWTTGLRSQVYNGTPITETWRTVRDASGWLNLSDFYASTVANSDGRLPAEDPEQGDMVDAGEGDDYVWGGLGGDEIIGRGGNDALNGMGGNDVIEGGLGGDILSGDYYGHSGLIIGTSEDSERVYTQSYPFDTASASGSSHGDDLIDAGEGNDQVWGDGGSDLLWGGSGNDTVFGDAALAEVEGRFHGQDMLDGDAGNDLLRGGGEGDTLWGGAGNDELSGDDSEERVAGEFHGDDWLDGEDGDDRIFGDGGSDSVYGGNGNDRLWGDYNYLSAQFHGDDYLDGGEGDDLLYGNGGNDILIGGGGVDGLFGDDGDDYLVSDGDDYLEGGADDDVYEISLLPGAAQVSQIVDREGVNTILINGASVDWARTRVLTSKGTLYLVLGDAGAVALGGDLAGSVFNVQDASGEVRSLQAIIDASASGGRIPSGFWSQSTGWVSTASIVQSQTITGVEGADHLVGAAGDDKLLGGGGSDLLEGAAGSDLLYGGAGADVLDGGTGDDVLRGGDAGQDAEGDVYRFERGDGADLIEKSQTFPSAPLDVIRFGVGVLRSDVQVSNLFEGTTMSGTLLVINYGQGDSITLSPGAEKGIKELQFADGTTVALSSLISVSTGDGTPSLDGVLRGTEGVDTLTGTDRDERIEGLGGNDTLIGGEGADHLVGGTGHNTYRFTLDSGADTIEPVAGEVGILAFVGAVGAARIQGNDLLLTMGGSSLVRVVGYASDPSIASSWLVDSGDGQLRNLGEFVEDHLPSTQTLEQRKQKFLDDQFWQLRLEPQARHFGPTDISADAVVQQRLQMATGDVQTVGTFLAQEVLGSTTLTVSGVEPIYRTATVNSSISAGWRFFSTAELHAMYGPRFEVPSGAIEVDGYNVKVSGYDNGYLMPFQAEPDSVTVVITPGGAPSSESRIVGYRQYNYSYTTSVTEIRATQSLVTGTSSADQIVAEYDGLRAGLNPDAATTGTWRGALEAGGGNDVVSMVDVSWNPSYAGALRLYDWTPIDWAPIGEGDYNFFLVDEVARGLGAWIDMGSGDDRASGTDADDFMMGGAGSDWLDGAAGADTYYVGTSGEDIDRISDLAKSDGTLDLPSWLTAEEKHQINADFQANAKFDAANKDVVEFDPAITMNSLTYRWSAPYAADFGPRYEGDQGTTLRMLEFYKDGRKFLEIEYEAASRNYDHPVSLPGIELFKFADGTQFDLQALLDAVDDWSDGPSVPLLAAALEDVTTSEDVLLDLKVPAGTFTDPQGQLLSMAATMEDGSSLPAWLQFDQQSQTLTGMPANGQVGQFSIRITATNEEGLSVSDVFALKVANVNDAPFLAVPLTNQVISEDTVWRHVVPVNAFADVDIGDTLTFSATLTDGAPLPSWISFDAATRTFSGIPGNGDVGTLELKVVAADAAGATASSRFELSINNLNDAPVVSSPLAAVVANEDATWQYELPETTFADIDNGDTLTWHVNLGNGDDLPSWLSFDAATRTLSGTPDNVDVGALDLSVTATDTSGASATTGLALIVSNVNDAPTVAHALDAQSATQDTAWSYVIPLDVFADQDAGDALSLNVRMGNDDPLPSWISFDAATRTLSGTPGAVNVGALTFNVIATDRAGATANQSLALNVKAPPITGETRIGTSGSDILQTGAGDDFLRGGAGSDILLAGNGNNVLDGDEGGDILEAGTGNDTLRGGAGGDILMAGDGNNTLDGGAEGDILISGGGNDWLDGGTGSDILQGGAGDDTYVVDSTGDLVVDTIGIDTVRSSIEYTLGFGLDNLVLTGSAARKAAGNAGGNTLTGNAAANVLDGAGGQDQLIGGAGNDTYLFQRGYGRDVIVENDATVGNIDVAQFGAGINSKQLWFRRAADDLEVSIVGTSDRLVVDDWYLGNQYHIEQFKTGDGKTLLDSQVQNLVQAMASFSPPPAGQTTLPATYQSSLNSVIAANWQ